MRASVKVWAILCMVILLGGIIIYLVYLPQTKVEGHMFYSVGFVEYSYTAELLASIDVNVTDVAAEPISEYLFGKFLEHHGSSSFAGCIYHGIWAQILDNPGFEKREFFGLTGINETVAYRWERFGDGQVIYGLSSESIGPGTSQLIRVNSLLTQKVGIRQSIYMPLHRTKGYNLSLWLRGKADRLLITVETTQQTVLAEALVEDISAEWTKYELNLTISDSEHFGELLLFSLTLDSPGYVNIDNCFLFPDDNIDGFDPDVIRMLRESGIKMIRWPGGNFASQYHWKDGVGPIEKRSIRLNEAWNIPEYNHVGTDEFIRFCKLVGAEPLICVNAGDGTPEEAADWVEYCNGDLNTTYGRLRAENGHPEPYNVKYWEIGNELYGSWQRGYCTAEQYAERYERFHRAMSAKDPNIKFIANGGWDRAMVWREWYPWDTALINRNGEKVRSLSRHYLIWVGNTETDYLRAVAYTFWLRNHLDDIRTELKKRLSDPKIAITEIQGGRDLDISETLLEALFYSGLMNSAINMHGFIEIVTHSSLMWFGGGLRKEREITYQTPASLAQQIYSMQPGRWPVRIKVLTPTFNVSSAPPEIPAVMNVPFIDAVGLINENRNSLSLIITNFHPSQDIRTSIRLHSFTAERSVSVRTLNGAHYLSKNSWNNREEIKIRSAEVEMQGNNFDYILPAHSITLFIFQKAA
ncbi:MAG: hypothetical protein RMJ07_01430 [Nitrososphaerota archaeon]|nr:hypothetical protein [Candidatus Bathyarchaeota archaeon]MDW8048333.1 hypothetical protein [Nitrososphaerota archaeon]